MPLSKEAMREYQRQRRGKTPETTSISSPENTTPGAGETKETKKAPFHEHYWLREGGTVRCVPYHYQRRDIGGCGEIRAYEGKLIPSFDDDDLVSSIARLSARVIDSWLTVPGPINTGKKPQRDAP